MHIVDTKEKLRKFRAQYLSPQTALPTIANTPGALLYPLPVGAGKSYFVDELTTDFADQLEEGRWPFDSIILTAPTHKILAERRVLKDVRYSSIAVLLSGRPRAACGEEKNRQWNEYERCGSFALGKERICGTCHKAAECAWPNQFNNLSSGQVKIVLLPQKYIEVEPGIITRVVNKLGSRAPLVIFDESNFSSEVFKRELKRGTLEVFSHVIELCLDSGAEEETKLRKYRNALEALLSTTEERQLYLQKWYFPPLERQTALQLQDIGMSYYGENFYYPAFDLNVFSKQYPGLRQINEGGHIEFNTTPCLEGSGKLIVLSGTASARLLKYRLDVDFTELFTQYTFKNQNSHIYNINIGSGCSHYHAQHLEQLAVFAVGYIQRSFKQGKSVALITKKKYVDPSIKILNAHLIRRGWGAFKAVKASDWDATDPAQIPVLHYGGAIGENTYTDIDNVLCLSGYYMRQDQLNRLMNEVTRRRYAVNFTIAIKGFPKRRIPVADPAGGVCPPSLYAIATQILKQEEMGVVIQAIGRIRPLTLPGKEVVLCQCGVCERLPYDREFPCLQEAREFFNIPDVREVEANRKITAIQYAKKLGMSQRQAAQKSTISISTIRRGWNRPAQLLPMVEHTNS
jgi:hypothetical protein